MAGCGFCLGIDWHHDDAIRRHDRRPELSDSFDLNSLRRQAGDASIGFERLFDPVFEAVPEG